MNANGYHSPNAVGSIICAPVEAGWAPLRLCCTVDPCQCRKGKRGDQELRAQTDQQYYQRIKDIEAYLAIFGIGTLAFCPNFELRNNSLVFQPHQLTGYVHVEGCRRIPNIRYQIIGGRL